MSTSHQVAAASVYVPGTAVAFFAQNLPLIQGIAGILAGVAAALAIAAQIVRWVKAK